MTSPKAKRWTKIQRIFDCDFVRWIQLRIKRSYKAEQSLRHVYVYPSVLERLSDIPAKKGKKVFEKINLHLSPARLVFKSLKIRFFAAKHIDSK
jgi:hypothetical protein